MKKILSLNSKIKHVSIDYIRTITLFNKNARILLLNIFLMGTGMSVFSVLFNLYLLRMGYGEDQIGIYQMSIGASIAMLAIPSGYIIDRFGFKRPMIIASVITVLAVIFQASFYPIIAIVVFTFVYGGCVSLLMVADNPFMMENSTRNERAHLFSISFALMMLTGFFGGLLGGYLPGLIAKTTNLNSDDYLSYRYSLYISILFVVASVIPFFFIEEKGRGNPSCHRLIDRFRISKIKNKRLFARLLIPNVLIGFGAGLIVPFINVYLKNQVNASTSAIGLIFSLTSVLTGLMSFGVPILTKKFGKINTVVFTQLFSLPFLIGITLSSFLPIVAFFVLARSVIMNLSTPAMSNFSMESVASDEKGLFSGFSGLAWNGTWAISNIAAGFIMARISYLIPYYICAVLYFLAAILYFLFFRKSEEREAVELILDEEHRL
ncbi:MAG: MFS transporter [Actinobacteria bacterium]|nr:MFS transporter [Actinomycetota bacterium]